MAERQWSRERAADVLLAGAALLAVYAALVGATGGFDFRFAGVKVSSHSWVRPALAAAALAAGFGLLARRRVAGASRWTWRLLDHPLGALTIAVTALAWSLSAGIRFGAFAAGGSDSYGYVSQAALIAEGRIIDTVPVDPSYTWYLSHATLTPLGYTPMAEPGAIAPTYPPGLPFLMAPAWLLSPSAVYYVVPLFSALAVWLCYRLGRALEDPLAGALAGMLLSVSPTFLFQTMQPMSDVPATACWLAALLMASNATASRAVAAGAIASVAILIRPNLTPLALVPLAVVTLLPRDRTSGLRNAALFIAAAIPGAVTLGWIQNVRYGSPLASGYGRVGELFSWENIQFNIDRYPKWLTDTHTPFVWFCVATPWLVRGRPRSAAALGWSALAFSAGVLALYLPYVAFKRHEWTYLRFLLPAIPLMLLLASATALRFVRVLAPAVRAPLTVVFFGAIAIYCAHTADRRRAFELRAVEQRYADAGEYVRARLPANAIVLAGQHSGSVRLYGERPILRFDLVQPDDLDRAVAQLRAKGLAPFMVVDPSERTAFYERFSLPYQKTLDTARLIRVIAHVQVYAFD